MTDNLVVFRFDKESLLSKICEAGSYNGYELFSQLISYGCLRHWNGNLWHMLIADELIKSENAYSLMCEMRTAADGSIKALALRDMKWIKKIMGLNFSENNSNGDVWKEICSFNCDYDGVRAAGAVQALAEKLDKAASEEEMLDAVSEFYVRRGCGIFGLYNAFAIGSRDGHAVLQPLDSKDNPSFDDLVAYETQKAALKNNTESFIARKTSNNVLLYGDAGTGKSTSIQALLSLYADRGLRIIEVYRHQYKYMPEIISQISKRNYSFILLLDDLSFEENETEYKYLKAVMEGGVSMNPENVRIYATSNRRHLVREDWSDKNDMQHSGDVHRSETMEEKLSLAMRFGLQIFYPAPDFKLYQNIVSELAEKAGIEDVDKAQLAKSAAAWQISHGNRSGRTAKQFIASLNK